ncbi:hypothetical protein [Ligilactobacillus sp. LYQ60]|uniref:hypothetical protein n=1 Tax=Ligilactobacillus sp. LYQ60 TaxID=3378799 RepID=UPI003852150F
MDAIERAKTAFYDYECELYGEYGHSYSKLPDDHPKIVKLQALMNCWCGLLHNKRANKAPGRKRKKLVQGRESLAQVDECIKARCFFQLDKVSQAHVKPLTDDERRAAIKVMRQGGSVSDLGRAIHRDHDGVMRAIVTGVFDIDDVAEWRWLMNHRYMARSNDGKIVYAKNVGDIRLATGLHWVDTKKALDEAVPVKQWTLIKMNHDNIPQNTLI